MCIMKFRNASFFLMNHENVCGHIIVHWTSVKWGRGEGCGVLTMDNE